MTKRPLIRYVLASVVAIGAVLTILRACAPEGPSLAFTWEKHPDLPLDDFAKGQLGILQPTYARSYLVVAFRYLMAKPLTQPERSSVLELWDRRLGGGTKLQRAAEAEADAGPQGPEGWVETRARFLDEKAPQVVRFNWDRRSFQAEVGEDALAVAASTLRDRAKRWTRERTAAWIRVQDKVFASPGGSGFTPDPLPADADQLSLFDRAYQVASARFYAKDFQAARGGFQDIANAPRSPWRRLAAYLVGRCWLRQGELSSDGSEAVRCYREAHQVFSGLRNGGLPAKPFTSVPEPLDETTLLDALAVGERRALALGDPEIAEKGMVRGLVNPDGAEDFGEELERYTNLLDANISGESDFQGERAKPRDIAPGLLDQDLSEWVYRFAETGPRAYALARRRWQERHALPWLLMALTNAETGSQGVEELLEAGSQVPEGHPAFETLAFHRARIMFAQGKGQAGETLSSRFVDKDGGSHSPSALNLWRALRMPHAETREAFLKEALRAPAGSYGYGFGEYPAASSLSTENAGLQATHPEVKQLLKQVQGPALFLQGDGAYVLNRVVPAETFIELARSPELPLHLRREWTRAAWVRAVLLERWDLAVNVTPDLVRLEPGLEASLHGFTTADPQERSRIALLTLLRNPGLRWMVFQGINHRTFTEPGSKPLPLRQRDTYLSECWWSSTQRRGDDTPPVYSDCMDWNASFYYPEPEAMERPLFDLWKGRPAPLAWLSKELRDRGAEEGRRLLNLEGAPAWLGARALIWAQETPEDTRVPEALHWAVRAGKVGDKNALDTKCFRLLHHRYPGNPWTAKTPIHY